MKATRAIEGFVAPRKDNIKRLVQEELQRLGWREGDLVERRKGELAKVRLAQRYGSSAPANGLQTFKPGRVLLVPKPRMDAIWRICGDRRKQTPDRALRSSRFHRTTGGAPSGCPAAGLRPSSEFAIVWRGMSPNVNPAQLLSEIIEPLGRAPTPSSAREILSVRASDAARQRITELAGRCNRGTLTPEENAQYQLFVEVGDVVALLQTRARLYLSEHPA